MICPKGLSLADRACDCKNVYVITGSIEHAKFVLADQQIVSVIAMCVQIGTWRNVFRVGKLRDWFALTPHTTPILRWCEQESCGQ
jgi:hypothetical protein